MKITAHHCKRPTRENVEPCCLTHLTDDYSCLKDARETAFLSAQAIGSEYIIFENEQTGSDIDRWELRGGQWGNVTA